MRVQIALQQVADGHNLKQIAENLGMSYQMLKNRLSGYYKVIGAKDLPHAIAIEMRERRIK